MIKKSINKLVNGDDLTYEESTATMKEIMSGVATNAQIGAFLTALRMKGETADEITAFHGYERMLPQNSSLCKGTTC